MRFYRCVCGHAEPMTASRCLACGARRERITNRCGQVFEMDWLSPRAAEALPRTLFDLGGAA